MTLTFDHQILISSLVSKGMYVPNLKKFLQEVWDFVFTRMGWTDNPKTYYLQPLAVTGAEA